jgi:hypothetical protein
MAVGWVEEEAALGTVLDDSVCFLCLGLGELFLNSCEMLMACAADLVEDQPLGFPDISMSRVVVEMAYKTREEDERDLCMHSLECYGAARTFTLSSECLEDKGQRDCVVSQIREKIQGFA